MILPTGPHVVESPRPGRLESVAAGAGTCPRPPWLWLGRVTWIATAIASLGLFAASVPVYFMVLQQMCTGPSCLAGQLTARQAHTLAALGMSRPAYAAYVVALDVISTVGWCAVAMVLFWRRSDDRMALFCSLTLLTFGSARFPHAPVALAATHPSWWLPVALLRFLGSAYLSLFCYLFPTGRFVPWWARWAALAWILAQIPEFFFPTTALSADSLPLAIQFSAFATFVGSVLVAQVYCYRTVSSPAERRQTRWVVLGLGVALACYLGFAFGVPLLAPSMTHAGSPGNLAIAAATTLSMLLIPISLAIAILRYRLYDVDLLINRLLVYGSLTAALALVYVSVVVVVQAVLRRLIGLESDLALVASTLATAALFRPLRTRIQAAIDRRFYRRTYNAARTLETFSATVRREVDLTRISDQLLSVVRETMQPEHASLWLRPPGDTGPRSHATQRLEDARRDVVLHSAFASGNDSVTESGYH